MKAKPIAILCSDLHLGSLKPACRAEEDWFAVQAEYLRQLKVAAEWHKDLDIVCAGDIFDRWNPSPETINFALKNLPKRRMLCVPGQHDLPNHRLDQVHRSGYGVLVEAGCIHDISGTTHQRPGSKLVSHGFAWGQEITPPTRTNDDGCVHLAVIHKYCFTNKSTSYPGAPETNKLGAFKEALRGYDAAVFGDNHKGFLAKSSGIDVMNTGGFIRRKSDEMSYQPTIGLLHSDGSIESVCLDVSKDKFAAGADKRDDEAPVDMKEFIRSVEGLGEHGLNFKETVENYLRDSNEEKAVKQIIIEAIES